MKHGVSIVLEAIGYMGWRGLLYGGGFGAVYGSLFTHIVYGTLFGLFFGALVGIQLGAIGGLVIGCITALFFNLKINPLLFRWFLIIIGGLVGFSSSFLSFAALFGQGACAAFIPALIATICALYVSSAFAEQHLSTKQKNSKGKTENAYDVR